MKLGVLFSDLGSLGTVWPDLGVQPTPIIDNYSLDPNLSKLDLCKLGHGTQSGSLVCPNCFVPPNKPCTHLETFTVSLKD